MTHLGETIRMLRIEHNMSQSQLAQSAGVARSYVSMIESGARTNIGTQTLERMAAALDLPAGAILYRVGVAFSPLEPLEISPQVRRLAERIDALPPGAHERAISLVDSVVRGLHAAHREQAHAEAMVVGSASALAPQAVPVAPNGEEATCSRGKREGR